MELHLEQTGRHLIQAYRLGNITVDNNSYHTSLIISPIGLEIWQPQTLSDLIPEHFQRIIQLTPEVLLLGTGEQLYFPAPSLLAEIYQQQIGVEVMNTQAACYTYNVLASEGRNVVAALLIA
jgi:uncharacterized protein